MKSSSENSAGMNVASGQQALDGTWRVVDLKGFHLSHPTFWRSATPAELLRFAFAGLSPIHGAPPAVAERWEALVQGRSLFLGNRAGDAV